ncbi:hypothetical protein HELRODRAFT_183731 [Helobdella robusta]|uniref:Uncharacterized protein n=1 Tax=Helobdella robusta TaxID=6412 RepID=T1FK42_HELRO|nr:hypothetical protein HELRODRAFT_183731 [Helobdella robusta]ESO10319.1 hypothetical protein HELRODRAFT_183731 [Helobdella robusta]
MEKPPTSKLNLNQGMYKDKSYDGYVGDDDDYDEVSIRNVCSNSTSEVDEHANAMMRERGDGNKDVKLEEKEDVNAVTSLSMSHQSTYHNANVVASNSSEELHSEQYRTVFSQFKPFWVNDHKNVSHPPIDHLQVYNNENSGDDEDVFDKPLISKIVNDINLHFEGDDDSDSKSEEKYRKIPLGYNLAKLISKERVTANRLYYSANNINNVNNNNNDVNKLYFSSNVHHNANASNKCSNTNNS